GGEETYTDYCEESTDNFSISEERELEKLRQGYNLRENKRSRSPKISSAQEDNRSDEAKKIEQVCQLRGEFGDPEQLEEQRRWDNECRTRLDIRLYTLIDSSVPFSFYNIFGNLEIHRAIEFRIKIGRAHV